MPSAWVIEIKTNNTEHQHGLFEFGQLPGIGDRVALRTPDQAMHAFGVAQIEHYPARVPPGDDSKEPSAAIYVTWLNEVPAK